MTSSWVMPVDTYFRQIPAGVLWEKLIESWLKVEQYLDEKVLISMEDNDMLTSCYVIEIVNHR